MKFKAAWFVLILITSFALSWLYLTKQGFADFISTVREIQNRLKIEGVKLTRSDRIKINFDLLIENPQAREIQLEAVTYMLYVNEQYAGHYSREYNQMLSAGLNRLAQELELNPIYQETLKAELQRSEMNLDIRGEVRLSFQLPRAEIKIRLRTKHGQRDRV